jgi:single-stranded DNA-binding protein
MDYQRILLIGNATRDSETQISQKGDVSYTTFTVGVGDLKGQSTFFPVVAFGNLGEIAAKYINKGKQVLVEGRIDVSENGRFSVVADNIRLGASAYRETQAELISTE